MKRGFRSSTCRLIHAACHHKIPLQIPRAFLTLNEAFCRMFLGGSYGSVTVICCDACSYQVSGPKFTGQGPCAGGNYLRVAQRYWACNKRWAALPRQRSVTKAWFCNKARAHQAHEECVQNETKDSTHTNMSNTRGIGSGAKL